MTPGEFVNCQTCKASFVWPRTKPSAKVRLLARGRGLTRASGAVSAYSLAATTVPALRPIKLSRADGVGFCELAHSKKSNGALVPRGAERPARPCGPRPPTEIGVALIWKLSTRLLPEAVVAPDNVYRR